jgi:hypothetical protein
VSCCSYFSSHYDGTLCMPESSIDHWVSFSYFVVSFCVPTLPHGRGLNRNPYKLKLNGDLLQRCRVEPYRKKKAQTEVPYVSVSDSLSVRYRSSSVRRQMDVLSCELQAICPPSDAAVISGFSKYNASPPKPSQAQFSLNAITIGKEKDLNHIKSLDKRTRVSN